MEAVDAGLDPGSPSGARDSKPAAPVRFHRLGGIAFLLSVLVLAALPWSAKYWPTVDGPNHLAVVHIVQQLDEGGSHFSEYFTRQPGVKPAAYYYALRGLSRLGTLEWAEKLLASVLIALVPLCTMFVVWRFAPERTLNAYLTVPLATSLAVMSGVTAYMFSLVFAMFALGLAWRPERPSTSTPASRRGELAAAAALVTVATFFHPLGFVLFGVTYLALCLPAWRAPRTWFMTLGISAPAILFLLWCFASSTPPPEVTALAAWAPIEGILFLDPPAVALQFFLLLMTFSSWELLLRGAPVLLLLVAALARAWRMGIFGAARDPSLSRAILVLLLLFLMCPFSVFGWTTVNSRWLGPALMLVAAAAVLPSWMNRPRVIAPVALALTLVLAFVQQREIEAASWELEQYVDAGSRIPEGSAVLTVSYEAAGGVFPLPVLYHAWGHLTLQRGVVTPDVFAAGAHQLGGPRLRPLYFRRPLGGEFLPSPADFTSQAWAVPCPPLDAICRARREAELQAFRLMAQRYDRFLAVAAPEPLLERWRREMTLEAQVGKVALFRPNGRGG